MWHCHVDTSESDKVIDILDKLSGICQYVWNVTCTDRAVRLCLETVYFRFWTYYIFHHNLKCVNFLIFRPFICKNTCLSSSCQSRPKSLVPIGSFFSLSVAESWMRWLTGHGQAAGTHSSQVMRNDVGVNGGIFQIIPELGYIIQISFFHSPSSFIRYHCLVLWHALPRLLSVQTDLISIPLCSSDIAAPSRGVCWDWNGDQVTRHSIVCWKRPECRESAHVWKHVLSLSSGIFHSPNRSFLHCTATLTRKTLKLESFQVKWQH